MPTITDMGVARPQRAGASNDEHRHRVDQGIGQSRLGSTSAHTTKVTSRRDQPPVGTNHADTRVSHPLNGRAAALGLATRRTI